MHRMKKVYFKFALDKNGKNYEWFCEMNNFDLKKFSQYMNNYQLKHRDDFEGAIDGFLRLNDLEVPEPEEEKTDD